MIINIPLKPTYKAQRYKKKFAWLPKRISENTYVWLQFIRVFQIYNVSKNKWEDSYIDPDTKILCILETDEISKKTKTSFGNLGNNWN